MEGGRGTSVLSCGELEVAAGGVDGAGAEAEDPRGQRCWLMGQRTTRSIRTRSIVLWSFIADIISFDSTCICSGRSGRGGRGGRRFTPPSSSGMFPISVLANTRGWWRSVSLTRRMTIDTPS